MIHLLLKSTINFMYILNKSFLSMIKLFSSLRVKLILDLDEIPVIDFSIYKKYHK